MTAELPDRRDPSPGDRVLRARVEQAGRWAQGHVPGADLATDAMERERLAAAGLLAGGLAYRLFLWLVPFGLVNAAILSFWVREDRGSLEDAARELGVGGVAAKSAAGAIAADAHSRWYFLAVGLVLLVWFGMGAVRALRIAHALAWGHRAEKLRRAPLAGLAFSGVVAALIALGVALAWLREELGVEGLLLTLSVTFGYAAAALWVLRLLPHADAPWQALLPGAFLLALGAQALHLVVVLYLAPKLGRSSELYGTLGASTVILLWLYLLARLMVAAAFLNAARWQRRKSEARP
jgi:uncharacterized BrkB/YihY/UPF0761 family membrane protein